MVLNCPFNLQIIAHLDVTIFNKQSLVESSLTVGNIPRFQPKVVIAALNNMAVTATGEQETHSSSHPFALNGSVVKLLPN